MSGTVVRGLRGILSACCVAQSPIPFMCSSKKFQEGDKTIILKIIDGIGQKQVKQNKKKKNDDNKNESANDINDQNEEEDQIKEETDDDHQDQNQNENEKESGGEKDDTQGVLENKIADMAILTGSVDKEKNSNENEQEEAKADEQTKSDEQGKTDEQVKTEEDESIKRNEEEENNEEEEEKEPDFDYTFDINDRTVEGEEDTEFKEDIMTICEHIRNSVSILFDAQVVTFQASFGAKSEGHEIWLLNGDVSTAPNGFSQNLFRSVPGGEIDFIDFLIDQLSEDDKSRNSNKKCNKPQKTANQQNSRPTSKLSTRSSESQSEANNKNRKKRRAATSLSQTHDNGNNEFSTKCAEYDHRLATKDWHYCYSGFPDCLSAHYRVPRIFVILYRAHQAFPKVNEARLHRMIEQRLEAIDENASKMMVNVCIQCVHLYTAEEKTYQGQKLTNNMPKDVPSHPFASLVPAELSIKGLRDVGSTPDMYRPFCYKINCRDSPYRDPALKAKKPPDPPDRVLIQQIPKSEKWVKRLTNPYRAHSVKVVNNEAKTTSRNSVHDSQNDGDEEEVKLPPISPTRKSYSERLAPVSYSNKPFSYSFLEKVKKKNEMLRKRSQRLNNKWKNEYE
ncbi:hypothetical protein M9Y10_014347 [Tritrichomonas musculus]|uniref:Uncharacterized protein n=1 Tax=Tritrichomonas musculus TaxID=1915356 RepID=A0ABR2L177_9EUKA